MKKTVEQILQEKLHEQMKFNTKIMNEIYELRTQAKTSIALVRQMRLVMEKQMKRIEDQRISMMDCKDSKHHRDWTE